MNECIDLRLAGLSAAILKDLAVIHLLQCQQPGLKSLSRQQHGMHFIPHRYFILWIVNLLEFDISLYEHMIQSINSSWRNKNVFKCYLLYCFLLFIMGFFYGRSFPYRTNHLKIKKRITCASEYIEMIWGCQWGIFVIVTK